MDVKDYIKIFEQSSGLVLVIDVNFIIEAASDDFIKKTKTTRENIIGCDIFDAFPFNPKDITGNGESKIRASFNRVIKNKTADTLPIVRYDIPKPASEGGGFEAKYWKVVNSPILDSNNNVKYIIQRSDDVTENETMAAQLEVEQKALKQIEDSEKRYNMMLMKSPFAFAILKGKNKVITLANDSVKEMWGKGKDIEGKSLLEVLPEIKDSEFPDLLDKVYTTGTPFCGDEVLCPVFRNGKLEDVYFNFVYQPYLEADETISGITIIAYEVTAQVIVKKALEAQREAEKKALKLVEETNKRYHTMLMESPFAFSVMKGKNMVVTLANDLMKEFWGKGKDVEGKMLLEVLPEIKDQPFPEMIEKVYTTGIPVYANEILGKLTYNDQLNHKYFNVVFQPYYEADNSISGVTQIAYEVTEMVMARKKIEESDKRYNMMLMNSPFTFAVLKGKDLMIELANNQIKEVWGRGNDIEGKSLLEIMPELKNTTFLDMLDEVRATGIPFHGIEVQSPKNMHGNIKEEYFFNFVFQPYWEADQTISGITIIGNEVTEQVIAKRQIEESEQRLRLATETSGVGIWEWNVITNKIRWDAQMFHIYGVVPTIDGFVDYSTWCNAVVIEDRADQERILQDTVRNIGSSKRSFKIIRANDGMLSDIEAIETVRTNAEGNAEWVVGTNLDVTEQVVAKRKIEESERNLRQILDTMPQKITNADTEGNVIYFNKKWLDDTGLEFEKLKGWGWEKVIHPDDLEMTKTNWNDSFKTGEIFDMECRIINKEGAYKWHLSRALPIKDEKGKIKMWVGTNTDIHEQKDAKYKAETAQLAAEDAMQAKQQFLSNMSHEIRTPMNAIIGFTSVLLKSKLEKTQEEYLTAIKVSGDALLVLINDILDLAKVDAGKMTYEQIPFNLATSLSSMLQLFDIKLKEKNLELEEKFDKAIPKIIMGDPMRLRQIILNLISNAVKFTEVGKITMCVALMEQDAEKITIEFTVTDTGIGIHKNKLEHIFDDFGQATYENSRLYGGTGLGLTIVKKLIEQQDGTIQVESELGKGSAFSFQLSFAKTNQKIKHETEQVSNKQVDIKNISVLVAEDMPLNQLLIKILLTDFGFEVDIADNGKIAIEKLQQKKYDLVLMDLQMPEMNGFDATDHVRKKMKSNIPIIALTADVTSIDVEKALSVGMNDYISKPIDEQLLYSKIIEVLQKTE
jgi:PAS domain S-box-containing protein